MLRLYECKHLVGENEIDYHLSSQKFIYCEYPLFEQIIWMRVILNKSIVALNGKSYF